MILKRVLLRNFLIHTDSLVEFNPRGITAIIGENGSGKSSIIEAIYFALFGKSSKGKLTELIKWGKSSAYVELYFENSLGEFKVQREINRHNKGNKSIVYKFENGRYISYYQKNVDKELPKITGLTSKTFQTSGLIKQGEIEGLLSKKPKERELIIEELLGIQYYQRLIQQYNDKRKIIKEKLQALMEKQINVADIQHQIQMEEASLESLYRLLEETERKVKDLKSNIFTLSEKLDTLRIKKTQLENKKQILLRIEKDISNLKEKLKDIELLKAKLPEITQKYNRYQEVEDKLKLLKSIETILKQKENIQKQLQQLKLDMDFINSYRETAIKFEEAEVKGKELSLEIEKINQTINTIEKKEIEKSSLEKRISEVKKDLEFVNSYHKKAESYRQSLKRLSEIDSQLKHLNQKKGQLQQLKASIQSIESQMKFRMEKLKSISYDLKEKYYQKFQTLALNPTMIDEFINQNKTKIEYLQSQKEELLNLLSVIKTEGNQYKSRLENLQSLDAICPTCGRPFDQHEKEEILNQTREILDKKRKEYKQIDDSLKSVEEEIYKQKEIKEYLEEFKKIYTLYLENKNEKERLEGNLNAISHSISKLADIEKEKQAIEEELAKEHTNYGKYEDLKRKNLEREFERLNQEILSITKFLEETNKEELLQKKQEKISSLENIREFISKNTTLYGRFKSLNERKIQQEIENSSKELRNLEIQLSDYIKRVDIQSTGVDFDLISQFEESLTKELKNLSWVQEEYFRVKNEIAKEDDIVKEIQYRQQEFDKVKIEIENIESEITTIDEHQISSQKQSLEEELERVLDSYQYVISEKAKIEERIRYLKVALEDSLKSLKEIESLKKSLQKYQSVIEVLSAINKAIKDNALYTLPKITEEIFSRFNFSNFSGLRFNEDYSIILPVNVVGSQSLAQIDALSGGQRVSLALALRFAIAKMINNRLEFLILDEPTIHMDKARRRELVDLIGDIKDKNFVKQLIVVTHDEELEDRADTIYRVEAGDVFLV